MFEDIYQPDDEETGECDGKCKICDHNCPDFDHELAELINKTKQQCPYIIYEQSICPKFEIKDVLLCKYFRIKDYECTKN